MFSRSVLFGAILLSFLLICASAARLITFEKSLAEKQLSFSQFTVQVVCEMATQFIERHPETESEAQEIIARNTDHLNPKTMVNRWIYDADLNLLTAYSSEFPEPIIIPSERLRPVVQSAASGNATIQFESKDAMPIKKFHLYWQWLPTKNVPSTLQIVGVSDRITRTALFQRFLIDIAALLVLHFCVLCCLIIYQLRQSNRAIIRNVTAKLREYRKVPSVLDAELDRPKTDNPPSAIIEMLSSEFRDESGAERSRP